MISSPYKIDAGYMHPHELGSVVWCETVHDHEALDAARELVKVFRYSGQVTVEFRRDARDGSLHFMKIEPRPVGRRAFRELSAWTSRPPFTRSLPAARPRVATEYPAGIGWLWIEAYAESLVRNAHHNRRDLLRMLPGTRRIKAFGEDLTDPIPLVIKSAGIAA
jgi:predicted ATP-grasp superfamily ATP-dependent carboligase